MENVFVYGTLLSYFQHPLYQKIKREGIYIGNGFVRGILYDAGEYPVAIPDPDSMIFGEVYRIPEVLFFDLDDYEDFNRYQVEESLFRRKKTKVYMIKEKEKETLIRTKHYDQDQFEKTFAWIYWYNKSVKNFIKISDGDYIQYFIKNILHKTKRESKGKHI